MQYLSTRGLAPPQDFAGVLLSGLAPDGGLYMPESWPQISRQEIAAFRDRPYVEVAETILRRFVGDVLEPSELRADIEAAYAGFEHPAVAPLSKIGHDLYLLELFHGPTFAFKDFAMQVLGRLFSRLLLRRGDRATVVVATSGDTGSAAIAALGGLPNVDLFVIHPKGRVSEIQRLQMTTAPFTNVHNIALEGTFDDAQAIVKELFAEMDFVQATRLAAVNSINFARIAIQTVYYFTAAAQLGTAPVFIVPTGNFGDIFAGEAAMRMGLAVERLVIATNANDILFRTLNTGVYEVGEACATLSPSMDIQVASNFERALFEAFGRDSSSLRAVMEQFRQSNNRRLKIPTKALGALQARYAASRSNDRETVATIRALHEATGRIVDPHTAVALGAAHRYGAAEGVPRVVLSTAHPAKFPDAVGQAIGSLPDLPAQLLSLRKMQERMHILSNKMPLVRAFIEARLAHHET